MRTVSRFALALFVLVALAAAAVPRPAVAATESEAQKSCQGVAQNARADCLNKARAAKKECAVRPPSGRQFCSVNGRNISGPQGEVVKGIGDSTDPDQKRTAKQAEESNKQSREANTKQGDGSKNDPISDKPVKETSIVDYINSTYRFAALIGGLLAVLMLIYAGYRYMTSYGDPEKIADAKDIIEKTLLGLGLLIVAALILQTINPATVNPKANKSGGEIDFTKPKG